VCGVIIVVCGKHNIKKNKDKVKNMPLGLFQIRKKTRSGKVPDLENKGERKRERGGALWNGGFNVTRTKGVSGSRNRVV
jgi:hypothetical protein